MTADHEPASPLYGIIEGEGGIVPALARRGPVWIALVDPTPDDLAMLRPVCGLSARAVARVLGDRSPAVGDRGDYWFVSVSMAATPDGAAGCGRVAALIGPGYIVTVARGRRPGRAIGSGGGRPALDAGQILRDLLADAVSDHEDAVDAMRAEVIALGHRSLDPLVAPGPRDRASDLRHRLAASVDALDRLADLWNGVERRVGARPAGAPAVALAAVFGRARGLARSADALLTVVADATDYRDRRAAHRRTMRTAALLASFAALIATRAALREIGHPSGTVLAVAILSEALLVLWASTVVPAWLKRRTRTIRWSGRKDVTCRVEPTPSTGSSRPTARRFGRRG